MKVFAVLLAVAAVAAGSALRPIESTIVGTVDNLQSGPNKPTVHDLHELIAALEATNNWEALGIIAAELAALEGPSAQPLPIEGPAAVTLPLPIEGPAAVTLPLPIEGPSAVTLPLPVEGPSAVTLPLPVEGPSAVTLPLPIEGPSAVTLPLPISGGDVSAIDRPIPIQGAQVAETPVASSASGPLVQIILNVASSGSSAPAAVDRPLAVGGGSSVALPDVISPEPIESNVGELAVNPINAPVATFPIDSLIQGLPLEL